MKTKSVKSHIEFATHFYAIIRYTRLNQRFRNCIWTLDALLLCI